MRDITQIKGHDIGLSSPKIDSAVWDLGVPLVVLERTKTREQLCVWIAIRWLLAAYPNEKGFGTRKIASRAKVHHQNVPRWCDELEEMGLLETVGMEYVAVGLPPKPVYSIPLHDLAKQSNDILVNVLEKWGEKKVVLGTKPQRVGRPTKKRPPDPPSGEPMLPANIEDLWAKACPTARPIDIEQLAALASEIDQISDDMRGYGPYWVGRAILMAAINEDVRSIGKIKVILNRWKEENSFGSDLVKPERPARQASTARSTEKPREPRPGERDYYKKKK